MEKKSDIGNADMLRLIHLKIPGALLMNYYERIQKSLDFIESQLENEIDLDSAAKEACMSVSNFYRMFFALVGHSVKEYIRMRRISLAASDIVNGRPAIIDIAVKYDFEGGDAFSRAFKRISGLLPSEYAKQSKRYCFERVDIMDKYFDIQDRRLVEKYPDIKVLKELEPMRVAYYCYYGKNPEYHAFQVLRNWIDKQGLDINKHRLRIFGYDNPSPSSSDQEQYGYETCVTIDDAMVVDDGPVKTKTLNGGLYAVTSVRRSGGDIGSDIRQAWGRFRNWLKDSKFVYGGHQWMEEHLDFNDDANLDCRVDLYMPVVAKK